MVEIPQAETTEESKAPIQVLRTTELVIEKNADVSADRLRHKLTHDIHFIGQKSLQWQVCRRENPLLQHSLQTFDRCTDCRFISESCAKNMEETSPPIQERVP